MATQVVSEGREMSWLPEAQEEQMQLAFRIMDNAFKGKVHILENEIRSLRITNDDNAQQLTAVKKKNSNLECELLESTQRSHQLADENKELFKTVSQLKKQIVRLEEIRKKVSSVLTCEEMTSDDHNATAIYMNDDYMRSSVPLTAALDAQTRGIPQPLNTSYSSSGGLGNSQRINGTSLGESPSQNPSTSPEAYFVDGRASSPGTNPQVDGRMFFRSARSRLSYEAFNAFLANIKRLNNHQQSRDETLAEAKKIFGAEQEDLYKDFVQLLNRHV